MYLISYTSSFNEFIYWNAEFLQERNVVSLSANYSRNYIEYECNHSIAIVVIVVVIFTSQSERKSWVWTSTFIKKVLPDGT
jgi:hypothetical protein